MAEKKVTNQAAIDAANRANAAAAQRQAALQAEAARQQAIVQPTAQKAIPGISALSSGINARIAELSGTPVAYNPLTGKPIPTPSSSQLLQQSKDILGAITPTEISTAQKAALDYQKALEEAGKITFTNVPGAVYDTTGTGTGRNSAYDLLLSQFEQYGLGALVEPLKALITDDTSAGELTLLLRQTEPYKKRFAANAARIGKGLRALSEAEYLSLEDGYQSIMRNYGLPASYYAKGDLGRQEGFEKLIAGDVSAAELEDRIMTAQNRVVNAPPQVKEALQRFYPDINNSDILAYTLDPEKGLADIKRKVTAAEIGGAALGAGLATDVTRAEELAKFGVT
ncbi:MAG: hypothetical protein EB023_14205, partial [Flavobacteriia bacterium]|nr:hypothetical protein [Flavobacteriia bacterium]